MCLIKFVETIETHFMFNNYLSGNSAAHEVIRKNMVQTERPQMTIHHGACALHARSVSLHAPCTCQSTRETTHTRTHRHTFPHTHETCQHKHAYTHSNMISTAFPLQQCFRERTLLLRLYEYCLSWLYICSSRSSLVAIVSRLWAVRPGVRIPVVGRRFLPVPRRPHVLCGTPSLLFKDYQVPGFFHGGKAAKVCDLN